MLMTVSMCGCGTTNSAALKTDKDDPININAGLDLASDQVDALKQKARAGDGDAAFRLYLYYGFCVNNGESDALYWLRVAASNGSQTARQVLENEEKRIRAGL